MGHLFVWARRAIVLRPHLSMCLNCSGLRLHSLVFTPYATHPKGILGWPTNSYGHLKINAVDPEHDNKLLLTTQVWDHLIALKGTVPVAYLARPEHVIKRLKT